MIQSEQSRLFDLDVLKETMISAKNIVTTTIKCAHSTILVPGCAAAMATALIKVQKKIKQAKRSYQSGEIRRSIINKIRKIDIEIAHQQDGNVRASSGSLIHKLDCTFIAWGNVCTNNQSAFRTRNQFKTDNIRSMNAF